MTERHQDANFIRHLACPSCGSSDANSLYDDGHTYCFACRALGRADGAGEDHVKRRLAAGFLTGEVQALPNRGLTEAACQKFGYRVGKNSKGKTVQIADYRVQSGELVAQKLKWMEGGKKHFTTVGAGKDMPLYGMHLWQTGGKRIVITEGEIDAISVCQAMGLNWPVVSLPNGADGGAKSVKRWIEYLESFDQVVLMLDQDDPGRAAAAEIAPLLSPGRCAIAELPLKDPNEMLQAGRVKEIVSAVWQARVYRPDGIVDLDEIEQRVLATPEVGMPWFLDDLTTATFGRRPGELIGVGAGTGCGKTDFLTQQIAYDLLTLNLTVGVVFLEQSVGETGRRIAGKQAGKRFHVPDGSWTQEELLASWGALKATQRLHLYDSWGVADWPTLKSRIRYMVQSLGCQVVYLDHLTACSAGEEDDKKALDRIMAEAAGLAKSLNFVLVYVSHLATPEGKPHEEGGRVMIRHFRGSRALGFWSHAMFGIERDTQKPGSPAILRVLKDRFTGQANGMTFGMAYDAQTGLLRPCNLKDNNDTCDFPEHPGGFEGGGEPPPF